MKKYDDEYYIDKISLESEAFSKLREKHDIKPYNWYLAAGEKHLEANRKWILGEKEYIYLFFENDEIIGASMIKNDEVDLLFVNVKYQGKGYGRKNIRVYNKSWTRAKSKRGKPKCFSRK